MIRSIAALSLLCVAFAACDSPAGAAPLADRFALDVSAPVVLHYYGTQTYILNDTLQVEPDGTAERRVRQRNEYDNPQLRDTTLEVREAYTYAVKGTRIQFNNVCPPYAFCGEGRFMWGEVDGDGMRLHTAIDSLVPLTYRRLAP